MYATRYRSHWYPLPRHPSAKIPYASRRTRVGARSRADARSGTRPRYQNSSETVKYVVTAATSHGRALLKFGQTFIVAGYGTSQ
jgi:hypothetical protein